MTPFLQGLQEELAKLAFNQAEAFKLMKELAQETATAIPRRKATPKIHSSVGLPQGKGHLKVIDPREQLTMVGEEGLPYGTVGGFPEPRPKSPSRAEFIRRPEHMPTETPTLGYTKAEDIPSTRVYKYIEEAKKREREALKGWQEARLSEVGHRLSQPSGRAAVKRRERAWNELERARGLG